MRQSIYHSHSSQTIYPPCLIQGDLIILSVLHALYSQSHTVIFYLDNVTFSTHSIPQRVVYLPPQAMRLPPIYCFLSVLSTNQKQQVYLSFTILYLFLLCFFPAVAKNGDCSSSTSGTYCVQNHLAKQFPWCFCCPIPMRYSSLIS